MEPPFGFPVPPLIPGIINPTFGAFVPPIFPVAPRNREVERDDQYFRSADDCPPNETLYVNNLSTRTKERALRPFLESVCTERSFFHYLVVFPAIW